MLTRFIVAVLTFFLVSGVWAQSGALTVHVRDEADAPIPGVTVTLSNVLQLVGESALRTDADGTVMFPVLPTGRGYVVQAAMPGFATVRHTDIRVRTDQTQSVAIQLGEQFTERERVQATRDVVDLEQVEQATTFDETFVDNLPLLGRLYTNVLTLAPGVQDSDEDGNPNVHGARERDFQVQVGGVSNVDPLTGLRLSNVNIDAIEEIEVISAGAGVEFGRAQGGFGNIIEKQGSNSFEGLFSFTFRSSKLDGNGATGLPDRQVPDFEWLQPALTLSGPIVRDRVWYFLANEHRQREDPVNLLNAVSVQSTEQDTGTNRVTWQVSRRNKLAFSYLYDPLRTENIDVSSLRPPRSTQAVEFGGPTYRINWTAPFSPRLLVDSTVAYQDIEQGILPSQPGVPNACVTGIARLELAQCQEVGSGRVSGSHFIEHRDDRQRFTVKSQATLFGRWLGASHRLKLGFAIENERYFRRLKRSPLLTLEAIRPMDASSPPFALVSARVAVPESSTARGVGASWSVFAEDQIRPLSNLTVTVGARLDREETRSDGFLPFDPTAELRAFEDVVIPQVLAGEIPTARLAAVEAFTAYEDVVEFRNQLSSTLGLNPNSGVLVGVAMQDSTFWLTKRRRANVTLTNNNVSPFLGVAWDPFKNGKTKLAFTARRFYDKLILAVPLVELEPLTTDVSFLGFRDSETGLWELRQPSGINATINVSLVDRDLRVPYQDEFTFTFERELAPETSLSLTYLRRKFRDQLQDVDINRLPADYGRCFRATDRGEPAVVMSPGAGQLLTDPYTGEVYEDTDPGIGDGRLDDCVGALLNLGVDVSVPQLPVANIVQRPDERLDLYVQNPGWGDMFLVGNFNTADYEAFVVELTRRQYRNWQMNASYTWSETFGDAEDFNLFLGNDRTLVEDERGFLAYDQRHVVKVNAVSILPWAGGVRLGLAAQWQSGLPFSIVETRRSFAAMPPFLAVGSPEPATRFRYSTGQRNDQRNEGFWNFDVHLAKELNLGGVQLQVTGDVFNLLNDDSLRLFDRLDGSNDAVRRFGRRYQLGLRLAF